MPHDDDHDEPAPADDHDRGVSPRQLAANRRNARASTGPRTEDGRRRSAANATKHGSWSMRLFPIPGGLYAENQREFWLFVDGIIAGLGPRDALEVEQAKQVALAYMRLDRLDRLESDLADADGTLTPSEAMLVTDLGAYVEHLTATEGHVPAAKPVWIGSRGHVATLLDTAEEMVDMLRGPPPDLIPDWERLARFVRRHRGGGKPSVRGLWDRRHHPETTEERKRAFHSLVRHFWPTTQGHEVDQNKGLAARDNDGRNPPRGGDPQHRGSSQSRTSSSRRREPRRPGLVDSSRR